MVARLEAPESTNFDSNFILEKRWPNRRSNVWRIVQKKNSYWRTIIVLVPQISYTKLPKRRQIAHYLGSTIFTQVCSHITAKHVIKIIRKKIRKKSQKKKNSSAFDRTAYLRS